MNTTTGAQLAAQYLGLSAQTCEIGGLAILAVIAAALLLFGWLVGPRFTPKEN